MILKSTVLGILPPSFVSRLDHYLLAHQTKSLRAELMRYREIHRNQTAMIIGNGPSVDIELLPRMQRFVTFTCNKFYMCYPRTHFRPNYTMVVDNQMLGDWGDSIHQNADSTVFSADHTLVNRHPNGVYLPLTNKRNFTFSDLSTDKYIDSGGSVVVAAIQLAFFMGFKQIYLYGVDHSFKQTSTSRHLNNQGMVSGDGNHFISNYRQGRPWYPPDILAIELAFKVCCDFLDARNIELVNLTPDSQLKVVPSDRLSSLIGIGDEH